MKVALPILKDRGLQSRLCQHFGSTPMFMVIDLDKQSHEILTHDHSHDDHGHCHPTTLLADQGLTAVIVGGMGRGALNKLRQAGIQVYHTEQDTVEEALAQFRMGQLSSMTDDKACAGHEH